MTDKNQSDIYNTQTVIYAYYPIEYSIIQGLVEDLEIFPKYFNLRGGFNTVIYESDGTNPQYDNSQPFSCNFNHNIPEVLNDYYILSWLTSPHLNVRTVEDDDSAAIIRPSYKFDNGDSDNYIAIDFKIDEEKINNAYNVNMQLLRYCESGIELLQALLYNFNLCINCNKPIVEYNVNDFYDLVDILTNLATLGDSFRTIKGYRTYLTNLKSLIYYLSKLDSNISDLKREQHTEYILKHANKIFILNESKQLQEVLEDLMNKIQNDLTQLQAEIEEVKSCLNNIDNENLLQTVSNNFHMIHYKPIILLFNRYSMSNINGWDGNKIQTNDGYLLAPQVGTGFKEDGLFTGVVIGTEQTSTSSNYIDRIEDRKVGLFGYSRGVRSIFLNADTGSALFGKPGGTEGSGGQIIIDPSSSDALLYSSTFWKEYNHDGIPDTYKDTNEAKRGMLINLSKPEIRFGNNNFAVNSEGHLHAVGGGDIAGWEISDTTLSKNSFIIESGDEKYTSIHTKDKMYNNSSDGFWLGHIVSDSGAVRSVLTLGDKFRVNSDGTMFLGDGAYCQGDGYNKLWKVSTRKEIKDGRGVINSFIAYGTETLYPASNDPSNRVYIGTNGISLGNDGKNQGVFSVDELGNLYSISGTIGGWHITEDSLEYQNMNRPQSW